MFCSVIIPTIGRATLVKAVESVLDQEIQPGSFEVIVVNDSGNPLPIAEWQQSPQVQIIQNYRRERSFARNSGAAVAQGQYLYFLDDDDWLLPDGLATFWKLAQTAPKAAWLHGGIQVVDENGRLLGETNSGVNGHCLAQIMGGAWVPIQSSIIRTTDFFAVGGYSPFVRGTEDQDLCRRIAAIGTFANTPTAVACLFRGANWQTSTDYGRAAEDTRLSRDAVVNQPGIFRKMMNSAGGHSYWHGRIVHVYLGLSLWHIRHRRLFSAISRALYGAAALLLSTRHLVNPHFWQGVRDHHVPGSLHFIQLDWEKAARGSSSKEPEK